MFPTVRRSRDTERGSSLLETVAALGIMGFIAVAFISTLGTGARATAIANEQTVAESLARSQIEYIKSSSYTESAYPILPGLTATLPDWDVSTSWVRAPGHESEAGIQNITVQVKRNEKLILSVDTYKVDR